MSHLVHILDSPLGSICGWAVARDAARPVSRIKPRAASAGKGPQVQVAKLQAAKTLSLLLLSLFREHHLFLQCVVVQVAIARLS